LFVEAGVESREVMVFGDLREWWQLVFEGAAGGERVLSICEV
jgi:hypothetical protein